jgi:hypothetical protein
MNKQAYLDGYMYKESRDASVLPYRPTAEAFLENSIDPNNLFYQGVYFDPYKKAQLEALLSLSQK